MITYEIIDQLFAKHCQNVATNDQNDDEEQTTRTEDQEEAWPIYINLLFYFIQ